MAGVFFVATAAAADVVLVGNSYTLRNDLGVLVEEALGQLPGHEDATVATLAVGAFTFADHLEATTRPGPWQATFVDGEGVRTFALQDQSQIPGFGASSPEFVRDLEAAVELDAMVAAQGADTAFVLTWGRLHGDEQNPSIYPDYPTMQDRLVEGYQAFLDATTTPARPTYLVPAGLCWRAIWDQELADGLDPTAAGSRFSALYVDDGSHPTLAGTTLLSAALFVSLTGRDPASLAPPAGLDPAVVAELRGIAAEVVLGDPFGHPYPWARRWEAVAHPDVVVVADTWTRPLVEVDGEATTRRLVVGGAGDGEVRVQGQLVVDVLEVGAGGELALAGGTLRVTGSGAGGPTGEGRLAASGAWTTELRLPSGVALDLDAAAPLVVAGALVVDGAVAVGGELGAGVDVARAASVELGGPVVVPEGASWSVVDDGGEQVLRVEPAAVSPSAPEEPDTGCGCGATAPTGGWVLVAAAAFVRRKRVQAHFGYAPPQVWRT